MEQGYIPARNMSTHAIKTELKAVLAEVRPERKWFKRATRQTCARSQSRRSLLRLATHDADEP